MPTWAEFEREAPELAAAGRRLLVGADGVAIAFLATASASGVPGLSPVCPIFCGDDLFLSAAAASPKARHLRENPRFALHAFLGAHDEEFQVRGSVTEVLDASERSQVHDAIPFPSYQPHDPIFRLFIEGALWVVWERVGRPDTQAIRRRWPPPSDTAPGEAPGRRQPTCQSSP